MMMMIITIIIATILAGMIVIRIMSTTGFTIIVNGEDRCKGLGVDSGEAARWQELYLCERMYILLLCMQRGRQDDNHNHLNNKGDYH